MFDRVHQKLSRWFPTVAEDDRPELDRALVCVNLLRQRILVWVFVSFHLAIICQYFVRTGSIGSPYIGSGDLSALMCCIVFLIAAGRPPSPAQINPRHRFCEGAVFLFIFLGSGLQTGLLVPQQASMAPYVLTIFLSAAFFHLSGPKILALYGLSWCVWLAMAWHVSTDPPFPATVAITGTLSTVMAMIIARTTYGFFVKDFLNQRIIERHKQQQKELKTLNEISARLAHEIRNPLMSAGGFARRLLSSMSPDDPNREKAEIIVNEVGRLEAILRMILNYLKPLELHRSPTDPNQLVETALHSMAEEIKERKVRLNLQLGAGIPEISADESLMEQVVEVLVTNALSQMPDEATISVKTFLENNMFKLVMRYPVPHVSADDMEDFFYPFNTSRIEHDTRYYTADIPRSKILVEKHGGEIYVTLEASGEFIIHMSLPLTPVSLIRSHNRPYDNMK
jgi:signal transduction histidine kinase